jgi:hypothetical protein
MSRRIIALNVLIALVVVSLGALLVREISSRRQVPPVSTRAPAGAPGGTPAAPPARGEPITAYAVVPAKNLFSPERSEAPPPPPPTPVAAPVGPKPILHGVIVDDTRSRAWLEDPATKRTFGYEVGDTVGGGRLEKITADRVVITRPEGELVVLLRDPAKPRPAPVPAPGAPQRPAGPVGRFPPRPVPGQAAVPETPGVGAQQPAPQTLPVPPQLLRRPAVATPPGTPDDEDDD